MNNDLISRSALIGAFPVVTKDDKVSLIGALFGFVDIICNAPSVDAVEVVRCKDCKHHSIIPHTDLYLCRKSYTGCRAEFFCADGERREDG